MKNLALGCLALSLVLAPTGIALADADPTVDVPSIWFWPYTNNDETDTKWIPKASFWVHGNFPDGTVFSVEYMAPGGKGAWYSTDCSHGWSDDIQAVAVKCEQYPEDKFSAGTGVVPFKINMKNELAGKNATLFSGSFKVGKHHIGNASPNFKKNFGYYMDYDWTLPIAYLYPSIGQQGGGSFQLDRSPYLKASVWFTYRYQEGEQVNAYVFQGDKQLCKDEGRDGGSPEYVTRSTFKPSVHGFFRTNFFLGGCRLKMDPGENFTEGTVDLSKTPGEYTLKVLRNGKLARAGTFTVTADGKIQSADATSTLNTPWSVIPIQVLGDQDSKWSKTAWQKDALYGHPLSGFQAPSGK